QNMQSHTGPDGWGGAFFAGRRVLVTGGTSGIGAGIARGFLAAGAEVVAAGVGHAEDDSAHADDRLKGAYLRQLDVRDGAAVAKLVGGLAGLDAVVNCAGVIRRGEELDPEVFGAVVDINLTGSMRVCAAARPLLAATGGAILNMASMLS